MSWTERLPAPLAVERQTAWRSNTTTEQAATAVDLFEAVYANLSGNMYWSGESSSPTGNFGTIMPGTNPSIAAVNGGSYMIAFQDVHEDYLWVYSPAAGPQNTYLGMASTTSPSIVGLWFDDAYGAGIASCSFIRSRTNGPWPWS